MHIFVLCSFIVLFVSNGFRKLVLVDAFCTIINTKLRTTTRTKECVGINAASRQEYFQHLQPLQSMVDGCEDTTNIAVSATGATSSDLRSVRFYNLKKEQQPQLLCNFLMELGACSTVIVDSDADTDREEAIFDEFDISSMTRTAVTTKSWNNCDINAIFPASASLEWVMELVRDVFPDLQYTDVKNVENKDWVLHVQQQWKPIILEPFVLRFPWHTDNMVHEALVAKKIENDSKKLAELNLQGGIAFGTGEHPTTQLCLEFINNTITKMRTDKTCNGNDEILLMDYGAGSGVLGIAACKLDASLRAVGVDIDVDAVHIGNENADMNDANMNNYLSNLVQTSCDDEATSIRLKAYGSSKDGLSDCHALPDDLNGPIYDVCVVNILADPIVSLTTTISNLVKPGGSLGLSGILASQSHTVIVAYSDYFDSLEVKREQSEWVLIQGKRNNSPIK